MTTAIQVGIADDHGITRSALRQFIAEQADMALAGEAWDGRTAIELARTRKLDVLMLDLMMPGLGGLDAMQMIRARAPSTGILVFTSCPAAQYAVPVLRRGARGFLSKECDPHEIADALRIVGSGRRYLSATVAELMAADLDAKPTRHPHETLTDREFQLLIRFAQGGSSAQIADDMCLSPKTVSTYRSTLLNKLGLKSNGEMTHYALVHRLID